MELRQRALAAFCQPNPADKAFAALALHAHAPLPTPLPGPLLAAALELDCNAALPAPERPGRPELPELVHPQSVPRRSPYTLDGHCALVHSIAHIEFNAINLALDAMWRFAGMPPSYYRDWAQVAAEEAKHFNLLRQHLQEQGHDYGDFVAHDGLWTMCENTRHDVCARMALVPRTLEARGLDATPIIQAKLRKVGTPRALAAVDILDVILQEEVGHVAIGNRWYHWLCQQRGLDAGTFHAQMALLHGAPRLKPPFNLTARKLAGFSDAEIETLAKIAHT
jgi:uncharacterized ferritin-like protein (DUF455 family)